LVGGAENSIPLQNSLEGALSASNTWASTAADWNLTAAQNEAGILYCLGYPTASGAVNIIAKPYPSKMFIVENTTGQNVTIKAAGQTGITIASAKRAVVICNAAGTDFGRLTPDQTCP